MESLQKGCLKINESGKTRKREPEIVSLQNDARKCYLKSQLLIKKSSNRMQLSYHEKNRRLIKWYRCLKSNVGARNLCFLVRAKIPKNQFFFIGFLEVPWNYLTRSRVRRLPLIRSGIRQAF